MSSDGNSENVASLVLHLQAMDDLHNIIATQGKGDDELLVNENLQSVLEILQRLHIRVDVVRGRLRKCHCTGRKLFCLTSAIVEAYSLYVERITSALEREETAAMPSDNTELSISHQNKLAVILHFLVFTGLVRHFEFQFTILAAKQHSITTCSATDLFICCRNLLLCYEASDLIQRLLLPKHLFPLMGALLQLSYSPNACETLEQSDHKFCLSMLGKLLTKWSQLKDVVRCLFVIQGSATRSTPAWLRRACGSLLSKCLLREHGVTAVISALLTTFDSEMSSWKKAEVASHILSTPPQSSSGKETYYENICVQILTLLQSTAFDQIENNQGEVFVQILTATALSLYKKSPQLANQHFFVYLLKSFDSFYESVQSKSFQENADKSMDLVLCIENLHRIFIMFKHPDKTNPMKNVLTPHLPAMFCLFSWARNTVSHLRALLRDLLVKYLSLYKSSMAAYILLSICGICDNKHSDLPIKQVIPGISFSFDDDDKIVVTYKQLSLRPPEDVIADQDVKVESVIDVMSSCKEQRLSTQILILSIKNIGNLKEANMEDSTDKLLMPDEIAAHHLHAGESQLLTFALIMAICESSNPDLLPTDVVEICSFIKEILVKACKPVDDVEHQLTSIESLKTCFAVLGICMLNNLTSKQYKAMQELVPLLQEISTLVFLDKNEREIASDLSIAMATQGACSGVDLASFSKSLQMQVKNLDKIQHGNAKDDATENPSSDSDIKSTNEKAKNHNLIEEISNASHEPSKSYPVKSTDNVSAAATRDSVVKSTSQSVSEALSSIYDPSPAIRGAAFRYLTSCIKERADCVKEKHDLFYNVFMEQLATEDDSFVYLSIIQGLAEIVNNHQSYPEKASNLIGQLIDQYDKKISDGDDEVKIMKIGEVIVRVIRQLGELACHHGKRVIPAFFRGSRDKRAQVRTSCLSNLAELCALLSNGLSAFQHELCDCVCAIGKTDCDVTVRRAAIHVVRKLVESLESDILKIFPDTIRRFYALLKHAYDVDTDDVIRLHAQLAMEALDVIMRDMIFTEPERKNKAPRKKIIILP